MEKDTSEIVKELGLSQDFQTFYNENKEYMVDSNLSELLADLLQRKGLKNPTSSKMQSCPRSTATKFFPVRACRSAKSYSASLSV